MNQVNLYVGDTRLDLFQDEVIQLNLNVQDVQDISKIFTDYSQSFTVPASETNNLVFRHWYRFDITNTYDARIRQLARIELNSLPFRDGVIELTNVLTKGTEPSAYTLTFYGSVVNLTDLFGDDYLYDLDFSEYDHPYTDTTLLNGLTSGLFGGDIIYPLMSPRGNWFYNSSNSSSGFDNIAYHNPNETHGLWYYELKPAMPAQVILNKIASTYGVQFSSSFLNLAPFTDLYLWLHRKEGYMYEGQIDPMTYQLVPWDGGTGTQFDLANNWFIGDDNYYEFSFTLATLTGPANFGIFVNGAYQESLVVNSIGTYTLPIVWGGTGDKITIRVKSTSASPLTYRVQGITMTEIYTASIVATATQAFSRNLSVQVEVSNLMPEMKVKDFLTALQKMYNLVFVPLSSTEFYVETRQNWFDQGRTKDWTRYFDSNEVSYDRLTLYREISFNYQDTQSILGYRYAMTNPTGYGNLNAMFPQIDGSEFTIESPTEQPLFERLTDQDTSALTNALVYKSIKVESDTSGKLLPYVGSPVFVYAKSGLDISANPIGFRGLVQNTQVNSVWYTNTSNDYANPLSAYSLNFGGDIDPYFLQSISRSLYNEYYDDYITTLYDIRSKIVKAKLLLPIGEVITLRLNDKIVWGNNLFRINVASVNLSTGDVSIELFPYLGIEITGIPEPIVPFDETPYQELTAREWDLQGQTWDGSIPELPAELMP